MKETLASIQKHIESVFYSEYPMSRYGFTEKYSPLFDDLVYQVAVQQETIDLHTMVKELQGPIFKYNEDHTELFIASPAFRLLFNLNGEKDFHKVPFNEWFEKAFWDAHIQGCDGTHFPGLGYTTESGNIPEFMAYILKKEAGIAIHVLRTKHKINLAKDAQFITCEAPNIFELDNSDPIHVARYLMARV